MKKLLITLFAMTLLVAPAWSNPTSQATTSIPENCCEEKSDSNQPLAVSKKVSLVENSLIGSWENSIYPFEVQAENGTRKQMEGAFLKYYFNENGTYKKVMGTREKKIEEFGSWEVSEDASTLVITSDCTATQSIKIKYLQLDELVLEQSLKSTEVDFCTGVKDFFFNKI